MLTRRAFVLIALLAAVPRAYAVCAAVDFQGSRTFFAGPQPRTMALANLNGDAWVDAVVGGWDDNRFPIGGLAVVFGQPGGRWRMDILLEPEKQVYDVVAGDFDGDGDDDVAWEEVLDQGEGIIHLLRNDGGRLIDVAQYAFRAWNGGLVTGNFNGDAIDDFVFIDEEATGHLLLGRSGSLPEHKTFKGQPELRGAAAGDLDGDGIDDLAAGRWDDYDKGALLIFGADREKGFRDAQTIHESRGVMRAAVGDFDGNGRKEAIAFDSYNAPAIADLDGDGIEDLIYPDGTGLRVEFGTRDATLVRGDSYYTFWPWASAVSGEVANAAADLDHDGDLDVAFVTDDGIAALYNDGTGKLNAPHFVSYGVATGDFNGDGRDDVLEVDRVLLAGEGGEIPRGDPDSPFSNSDLRFARVADVDADGNLDALYFLDHPSDPNLGRVRIRLGNGDGTLRAPVDVDMGRKYQDAVLGDFNRDGNLDIIVLNSTSEFHQVMTMAYGQGDGTFTPPVSFDSDSFLSAIEAGDFNGDGRLDLARMTANTDNPMQVAFGNGPGTFADPVGVGGYYDQLAVADVNQDGLSDIIGVWTWDTATVEVFLGQRNGSFLRKPDVLGLLTDTNQIHLADFNADGHPDILLTEGGSSAAEGWMALMVGDGTGRFGPAVRFRATAYWIAWTGDFNGDGKRDVLDGGFPRLNTCVNAGPRHRAVR